MCQRHKLNGDVVCDSGVHVLIRARSVTNLKSNDPFVLSAISKLTLCALLLSLTCSLFSGCAQGSRVTTGGQKYARVPKESVQVLFARPNRPYIEIGMAMAQGAQLATDATAIEEVRSQAAKLGADAVIISGMERRTYFNAPGYVNTQQQTNVYGQVNPYGQFNAQANSQTTGVFSGPQEIAGTHVTGIAIKFR